MTGKPFNRIYLSGVTLSDVAYIPATVTGIIDVGLGAALHGCAGTIINQVVVERTVSGDAGADGDYLVSFSPPGSNS